MTSRFILSRNCKESWWVISKTVLPTYFFERWRPKCLTLKNYRNCKGLKIDFLQSTLVARLNRNCPAEATLILKPQCKVMLLWNISELLKNGTKGVYVGQNGEDTISVKFEGKYLKHACCEFTYS